MGARQGTAHRGAVVVGTLGLALWWPLLRRVSWFNVLYGVEGTGVSAFAVYGAFTLVALAVAAGLLRAGEGRTSHSGARIKASLGGVAALLLALQFILKVVQIVAVPAGAAGATLAFANALLFGCVYVLLACLWARWTLCLTGRSRAVMLAGSFALSFPARTVCLLPTPAAELLSAAGPVASAVCAVAALRLFAAPDPAREATAQDAAIAPRAQFGRALRGMPGLLAVFLVIAALARPLSFGPLDGAMLSGVLSAQDLFTVALAGVVLACCVLNASPGTLMRYLLPLATTILFGGLFLMANADTGLIEAGKQIMIVGRTLLSLLFWLLLADAADEGAGEAVFSLGLPFVVVDAFSSLLGYVLLPGLFGLMGLTSSELGTTLASAVTFALVVASVVVFARSMGEDGLVLGAQATAGYAGDTPDVAPAPVSDAPTAAPAASPCLPQDVVAAYGLTEREAQVAGLLAQGNSQKRIAELMGVSVGTVQSHVKAVYRKLSIHSKQELIDRARDL